MADFLRKVKDQVQDLAEGEKARKLVSELYAQDEKNNVSLRFVLLSALASGSDSLVAQEALNLGYELHVPLPMSREEYGKDFSSADLAVFNELIGKASHVFEIQDANPERGHSYADASRIVLNHSDVLLALWDKKNTEYVAGTAATMESAIRQHIPVVHIHANAAEPTCIITDNLRATNWEEKLQAHLESLLLPVEATSTNKADLKFTRSCAAQKDIPSMGWYPQYLGIPGLIIRAESWMSRLLRWLPIRAQKPTGVPFLEADTPAFTQHDSKKPAGENNPLCPACLHTWETLFNWYDQLANAYSARYRGGLVMRYLAPVIATTMLACALNWETWLYSGVPDAAKQDCHGAASTLKFCVAAWFILQGLFLLLPVLLQIADSCLMWHRKFFSYRVVCEQLRQTMYLGPVGFFMVRAKESTYRNNPQRWTAWYYRALIREVGLPHVVVNHEYLKNWLVWTRDRFVVDQMNYHEKRWRREGNMCTKLVWAALVAFGLGIVVACWRGYLSVSGESPVLNSLVATAALVIPALAVFWAGFCAYACYAKDQQVSLASGETLDSIRHEMDVFLRAEGYDAKLSAKEIATIQPEALHFTRAYNIAERIHECCKSELLGWEDLISTKGIKHQ